MLVLLVSYPKYPCYDQCQGILPCVFFYIFSLIIEEGFLISSCYCPLHYSGLEYKSRKSRNTWSNRQIWPWNMKWSRAKTEFCQENAVVITNTLFQQHKRNSTHGHHQMVNTEIRLIIFFAAKDGEALYSQQKQDRKLTVAQIMNSLLPNSDLNWRK